MGHSKLECLAHVDHDANGNRPHDNSIRAPEEKREKIQSFGQASAAAWSCSSSGRGEYQPGSIDTSSGGGISWRPPDLNMMLVGDEVMSPLKRAHPDEQVNKKTNVVA